MSGSAQHLKAWAAMGARLEGTRCRLRGVARWGPEEFKATSNVAWDPPSFDHLVGRGEELRVEFEAE